MTDPRPFSAGELESLCKTLGHTDNGLTGPEIGHCLAQARVADIEPAATKWKRLYSALAAEQNRVGTGKPVLNFVHYALAPARYVGNQATFEERRARANITLAFIGLHFRDDGKFGRIDRAETLGEAQARASKLRSALESRSVHQDVLGFCRAELLADNYFHAVLEASKSVADKIRQRTGLTNDGVELIDQALSGTDPLLRINAFANASERSEQTGFATLLKGLFGVFRNPTSHAPRVIWSMSEADALDLFSLASYSHRRLDKAANR